LWAIQALNLGLADIHLLLRSGRDSLKYSRLATSDSFEEPLSRSYAGPFARAVARVAIEDRNEESALRRIERASLSYHCDTMDQAEMACARIQLLSSIRAEAIDAEDDLRRTLRELPLATLHTLRLLGFGEPLEYAPGPPKNEVLFQSPL
jgi:hypothetical protein